MLSPGSGCISPEQLIDAVKVTVGGGRLFAPSVTRRLVESLLSHVDRDAGSGPDLSGLTSRETEVLRRVATGKANGDIARELLIGEATVKTHFEPADGQAGPQPGTGGGGCL